MLLAGHLCLNCAEEDSVKEVHAESNRCKCKRSGMCLRSQQEDQEGNQNPYFVSIGQVLYQAKLCGY